MNHRLARLAFALFPLLSIQAASAQDADDGFARSRGFQRCYGVFNARSRAEPDNLDLKLLASNFQLVAMTSRIFDAHTPAGASALAASAAQAASSAASAPPRRKFSEELAENADKDAQKFFAESAALPSDDARRQRLKEFTASCLQASQEFAAAAQKR